MAGLNIEREGISFEFSGDTAKFDDSINGINRSLNILKKEFGLFKKELSFDPGNISLLNKEMENLQQQAELAQHAMKLYDRSRKALKDADDNWVLDDDKIKTTEAAQAAWEKYTKGIEDAQMTLLKYNERMAEVQKRIEEVKSGLFAQNRALEESSQKWKEIGDNLKTVGSGLENAGRSLRVVSGAALAGLGGAAKAAMDFESALTGVYKTVDETPTTSYADIEKWIRTMATELPSTASEIANVAEVAGQLGISADALQPFVRTMIDLGNATNVTATDGAAAVAQFFNIMGYNAERVKDEVDNFGASLTALGNNAATDEESIVYMAKALAAAGHQIGLSSQEVLGLSTTLASLGLSAERGGSAMSTIFRKIETDAKTHGVKVEERLSAWGELIHMTGKEFREAWNTDTIGTIEKIIIGLGQTEEISKSLYEVLGDVDISNIRQIDTISRLANSEGMLSKYIAMANEEWEKNSALTTEANRRYGTTESQMLMLRNRINELGITLGETLLPIINDLIDDFEPYIDSMIDLAKTHGKAIIETLAFVGALSPLLTVVGKVTKGVGGVATAIGKYQKMAADSTGTTRSVALALANAGQYGLYGAAILAVAGLTALVGYTIYANQETVKYKKSLDQLSDSLNDNIERSTTEYRVRERQIDSAQYYVDKIERLREQYALLNDAETEGQGIRDEMVRTVAQLNAELGAEVYQIDASTGAITKNGQEVQNLAEDYKALAEEMKKQAWGDAYRSAYEESLKTGFEYHDKLQEAASRYSEAMNNIDYNGIKVGTEFVEAAQQYLNGEITDIQVLADIIRQNKDLMDNINVTNDGDVLGATRTLLNEVTKYQRDYATEIEYTTSKLQESAQFQQMYNDIMAAEPGQLDAVLAKYSALDTELGDNITQLNLLRNAYVQARDAMKEQGMDTAPYDQAIAAIDEQINKEGVLSQKRQENRNTEAEYAKTKTTETDTFVEQSNAGMSKTVLSNNRRTWDETGITAKSVADQIKTYYDSMQFKTKDWYVNVILQGEGAQYVRNGALSGYSSGFGNTPRSGGYGSGGYNITINPTINVSGALSSANAKTFAMQMVDVVNEELGKRLRLNG